MMAVYQEKKILIEKKEKKRIKEQAGYTDLAS